jgi:hypothetical protein
MSLASPLGGLIRTQGTIRSSFPRARTVPYRPRFQNPGGAGEFFLENAPPHIGGPKALTNLADGATPDVITAELQRLTQQPVIALTGGAPSQESGVSSVGTWGLPRVVTGESSVVYATSVRAKRVPGSAKGLFVVPDDFDEPLDDFDDYM